ncbi:MAG TPA: hypothetical protein VE981_16345 [Planctomycetota bacterium]|nr:hypothetical protein [Planctomycetota bacterium]
MKRDLVIALVGARSRVGRTLAARLRAEGHTVLPVPRHYGLLPGSDLLIHLGGGLRRLSARIPDAVMLPERLLTTSSRVGKIRELGIDVAPLKLDDLRPEEAVDLILWAIHHLEGQPALENA